MFFFIHRRLLPKILCTYPAWTIRTETAVSKIPLLNCFRIEFLVNFTSFLVSCDVLTLGSLFIHMQHCYPRLFNKLINIC